VKVCSPNVRVQAEFEAHIMQLTYERLRDFFNFMLYLVLNCAISVKPEIETDPFQSLQKHACLAVASQSVEYKLLP
jgi:hypothetical protein